MADTVLGANGDGTGSATETREVTITVRNDIPDATVRAIVAPLKAGTNNPVVGNLADLQRMGAVEIAKDGGQNAADPFKVNPAVSAEVAKAGAERTLDEEKANAEVGAQLEATGSVGSTGDPGAKSGKAKK